MKFLANFYNGLMEDLKAFIFWLLLLTIFRVCFLVKFGYQLPEGAYGDITGCLWLGTRLSLKTAGWICALGFILTTLPGVVWPKFLQWKLRWHAFAIFIFCILFLARFPYYRVFGDTFNGMIITAFHDDWWGIISTILGVYGAWWRIPFAMILTDIFYFALKMFLWYAPLNNFEEMQKKWLVVGVSIVFIPLLVVFVRYGGAFSYRRGISWLSAARFSSQLLNAAVLDDGQAMTRVVKIWRLRQKIDSIDLNEEQIRHHIAILQGNTKAKTIDDAFSHVVTHSRLQKQPRNIVLVLGEGLGVWSFEHPFNKLYLTTNIEAIKSSDKSVSIKTMLPAGQGTIYSIQSILMGIPFTGSHYNFEKRHDADSRMYLANIMKRLGYKTVFWYSGFGGWENIHNFVLDAGFDEFHHCGEFSYKEGNAWGACDAEFYRYFLNKTEKQGDEKVLHVLLPGSNHPPYSVDVEEYGFNREWVKENLPVSIEDSRSNLTALGHLWYSDATMGDMVREFQEKYPDTLFMITGDHAGRLFFAKEQDDRTRIMVPFVVYGAGVKSNWFSKDSVGCHQQIPATLAEILGPKGFTYSAFLPSMFSSSFAYNSGLWVEKDKVKQTSDFSGEEKYYLRAARELAAQRVLQGNEIK